MACADCAVYRSEISRLQKLFEEWLSAVSLKVPKAPELVEDDTVTPSARSKTHVNTKLSCPTAECEDYFAAKSELSDHLVSSHNQNVNSLCPVASCLHMSVDPDDVMLHMRRNHHKKVYCCTECLAQFRIESEFTWHCKYDHETDRDNREEEMVKAIEPDVSDKSATDTVSCVLVTSSENSEDQPNSLTSSRPPSGGSGSVNSSGSFPSAAVSGKRGRGRPRKRSLITGDKELNAGKRPKPFTSEPVSPAEHSGSTGEPDNKAEFEHLQMDILKSLHTDVVTAIPPIDGIFGKSVKEITEKVSTEPSRSLIDQIDLTQSDGANEDAAAGIIDPISIIATSEVKEAEEVGSKLGGHPPLSKISNNTNGITGEDCDSPLVLNDSVDPPESSLLRLIPPVDNITAIPQLDSPESSELGETLFSQMNRLPSLKSATMLLSKPKIVQETSCSSPVEQSTSINTTGDVCQPEASPPAAAASSILESSNSLTKSAAFTDISTDSIASFGTAIETAKKFLSTALPVTTDTATGAPADPAALGVHSEENQMQMIRGNGFNENSVTATKVPNKRDKFEELITIDGSIGYTSPDGVEKPVRPGSLMLYQDTAKVKYKIEILCPGHEEQQPFWKSFTIDVKQLHEVSENYDPDVAYRIVLKTNRVDRLHRINFATTNSTERAQMEELNSTLQNILSSGLAKPVETGGKYDAIASQERGKSQDLIGGDIETGGGNEDTKLTDELMQEHNLKDLEIKLVRLDVNTINIQSDELIEL